VKKVWEELSTVPLNELEKMNPVIPTSALKQKGGVSKTKPDWKRGGEE